MKHQIKFIILTAVFALASCASNGHHAKKSCATACKTKKAAKKDCAACETKKAVKKDCAKCKTEKKAA